MHKDDGTIHLKCKNPPTIPDSESNIACLKKAQLVKCQAANKCEKLIVKQRQQAQLEKCRAEEDNYEPCERDWP
ncbi:hypothetical protein H0H87_002260 [Tephrocybe sp. NHM501043]|nr:hypothetical protein H0H87_002260 [Tephrocybe sp. NHM501043]